MVLHVTNANNVKVYTVSGGEGSRSIPDWLARKKRRALKDDPEWRSRIELIQEFEFPEASLRIKTTRDGKYVMATGVYKPQMRVYEYSQMSIKFERHTDAENVNFVILSDDWTKSVLLQNDRSIEFHAQGGIHYRTRIPRFGRDLSYHFPTCDLLVGGAGNEVYRLNLDQGRFLNPIQTDATAINAIDINPAHQLFSFGTADGTVEFWDPRSRSRVGLLPPRSGEGGFEISALKSRNDGLSLAVGTSTGLTMLYDLRTANPWIVKDHQYGYPIKNIHWLDSLEGGDGGDKVVVADCKIIKIWDRVHGKHFTSIEPATDINDVCMVPDSGMMFVANEGMQMLTYYIPALGPAPKWCSFLDNLTEEMEENPQTNVYEDYKFVTRKELSALNLDHLIGSNMLRPYMHGFFMDLRLYEKARLIANPFAYAEYREKAIREKLEKERASRIRATSKLPKVNRELASRLLRDEKKKKKSDKEGETEGVLSDSRFAQMFNDPEFQVDEESNEFKLVNPTRRKKRDDSDEEDMEQEEEEEEEEEESEVDSDASMDYESEEEILPAKKMPKEQGIRSVPQVKDKKPVRGPRMIEMNSIATNDTKLSKKPLGERVKSERVQADSMRRSIGGGMEMTFKINVGKGKGRGKYQDNDRAGSQDSNRRARRSASKNTIRKLG
ncbi:uncharacterized protein VTP21DRAFT_2294 [Calcarisporiella thermophila]|uniref:uncharacterized protein n=1 Tax=Calcarisporiella thermophila TaxID=911321 RepID=UPI0037446EED